MTRLQSAELLGSLESACARVLAALGEDALYRSPRFRSPEWQTLAQWVEIARDHLAEHAQAIERWAEGRGR